VLDHVVAVASTATEALGQHGRGGGGRLVERLPRRPQESHLAGDLGGIEPLVVPGAAQTRRAEVRHGVAIDPADDLGAPRSKPWPRHPSVPIGELEARRDGCVLAFPASAPTGPVDRRGEDPR